jgi:2-polyprenyl-6-methoxyphenol hydroxylase-like FAD-dependent oxidoreductase
LRPDLHRIFSSYVRSHGVSVRLGVSVEALDDDPAGVAVRFSDGSVGFYAGVIGADGFNSSMRRLILPGAPEPFFTGQGCWRMIAPRPNDLTGAEMYFGPGYKVGVNPCSPDQLYLFVTMSMPGNPFVHQAELQDRMRNILAPIGGRIRGIRDGIGPQSNVNYRPLEALLLSPPWHVGRVGLIGDAIHSTTPHLASGAGLAVEDGVLLGSYLAQANDVERAWQDFEARRWDRVRLVVEGSLRICRLEQEGGHDLEVSHLMAVNSAALSQPM